jgi:hypothetical protein
MEVHRFECQCYSFHHTIRMMLSNEDGTVYLDVGLTNYLPWYKRIWVGIKYIFGKNVIDHQYHDSTHLQLEDYEKIRNLLDKSEKIINETR